MPELASWYATAQGLATTALAQLLAACEQPYAHTTVSGHHAVEALGQLAEHSAGIAVHIVGAVTVAAEYHRIDGVPDPVTGRISAQPTVHRQALDQHIAAALALIPAARAACHNAVAFTESAALREAGRAAEPAPLPELNWAEEQALRLITDDQVLLSADRRNRRRIWTGSGERISTSTVDSLTEQQLIRLDASGSLAAGQRLRPTEQGRRALDVARRSPVPTTLPTAQHRALHLIHTGNVTYWQWPGKQPTVAAGSLENITLRSVNALTAKGLIERDRSTSLHKGQRLNLTDDGHRLLRHLGPAPEPAPPVQSRRPGPAPAR
ncbi:hypothetical protein [Streptomyces sp. NPDC058622]|uniref:hypothetical protein n=1 Tax=Streptomyces sp. NPDC058622 TaxID=3346562 RepID=UPI003669ECF7